MKSRALMLITTALFGALIASFRSAAQAQANNLSPAPLKYTLKVLPGPLDLPGFASAQAINNRGWVMGFSNPTDGSYEHAILWREDQPTDLGTLGGYNSSVAFPSKNENGWVVGISETGDLDPYQENFAGFFCPQSIFPQCLPLNQISKGFLWQSETNEMIALPPLPGGNNSAAFGVNNQRQIVGAAENDGPDPNCVAQLAQQVFHFKGVVWSLGLDGTPVVSRQLDPLDGDIVSAGFSINESGEISGTSGPPCTSLFGGTHAVLWKRGRAIDLGSLGGVTNNVAMAINSHGQIVGSSDLPGDKITHVFLWEEGAMKDLGALPGDDVAFGEGINDRGEVVGVSFNSSGLSRGFHWQGGVMTDLSKFLPVDSALKVIGNADDINSRGEIAVQACDQTETNCVAAVLIPDGDENGPLGNGAAANTLQRTVILPENVRKMLQRRLPLRAPLTRPQ